MSHLDPSGLTHGLKLYKKIGKYVVSKSDKFKIWPNCQNVPSSETSNHGLNPNVFADHQCRFCIFFGSWLSQMSNVNHDLHILGLNT